MRFLAAIGLLVAQPALARPAEDQSAKTDKPKKSPRVCERVISTGSIMAHTECRSAAEWGALKKARQSQTEQFQHDGTLRTVGER